MKQRKSSFFCVRNTRSRQFGHANMFQELFAKLSGGKKPATDTTQNNQDPNNLQNRQDPNNKSKDPNDPNNIDPNKSKNDPLDIFKDLFKMPASGQGDEAPSFSLDPKKLQELAGTLSFADQMTPEVLEKFKSGDPETIQQYLNASGQRQWLTIMQQLPKLTETYVKAQLEHSQKGLGKSVKKTLTQQSLSKLAASNPVLAQQLEEIAGKLLEKFPDADADWIAEQTGQYYLQMAKTMFPDQFKGEGDSSTPTNVDKSDVSTREGFNWAEYISGDKLPAQAAGPKK